jgi:hypothetical protein
VSRLLVQCLDFWNLDSVGASHCLDWDLDCVGASHFLDVRCFRILWEQLDIRLLFFKFDYEDCSGCVLDGLYVYLWFVFHISSIPHIFVGVLYVLRVCVTSVIEDY